MAAESSFVPAPDAGPDPYLAAARAALDQFPVRARSVTLASRAENVTYRVEGDGVDGDASAEDGATGDGAAGDGATYVLRLHRPGYHDLDELVSERQWLAALAGAGIAVPSPVPASDGRAYVTVPTVGGEVRQAGLARWIPGRMMGDLLNAGDGRPDGALVARCYRQLGSVMAGLHAQASTWRPPPGFVRHRLDADGLMGPDPFWGPFWDSAALTGDQRRRVLAGRDRIHHMLSGMSRDPSLFSMIHADLHLGNVVIDGDRLHVIDFDDAGFGWHGYDIAVALFHVDGTPEYVPAREAFLDGYRSQRDLAAQVVDSIPLFLLVRRLAVLGWKHQRPEVDWPEGMLERIAADALAGLGSLWAP